MEQYSRMLDTTESSSLADIANREPSKMQLKEASPGFQRGRHSNLVYLHNADTKLRLEEDMKRTKLEQQKNSVKVNHNMSPEFLHNKYHMNDSVQTTASRCMQVVNKDIRKGKKINRNITQPRDDNKGNPTYK